MRKIAYTSVLMSIYIESNQEDEKTMKLDTKIEYEEKS